MRYGNPSTRAKLREMAESGCDRLLFFPLYPQYSGPTTATANDELFRALMGETWQPALRNVPAYFDRPSYIEALAGSVEAAFPDAAQAPDVLVCSYHGMPERYLTQGDPYHCQCQKTTRLLAERLGWGEGRIVTSFQSKFGPEEWLKPYTVEEVARLAQAGKKRIAVIAPAFSADCLETLEEINGEIRESFLAAGGTDFTYIPCLNDGARHLDMIEEIVAENLAGWLE
jgi:ferrochelatase